MIVRVLAGTTATAESPLALTVSARAWKKRSKPSESAVRCICQATPAGRGEVRVTFLCPALSPGESKLLFLSVGKVLDVLVRPAGKNAEVLLGGQLFTRYDVTTGPNKPYFYPIQAFGGKHLTRRWPLEQIPGEEKDHPHHRGLWFTHGAMNGIDFWTEEKTSEKHPVGAVKHRSFTTLQSGQVQGTLGATSDWVGPDGKTIATDVRTIFVTPLSQGGVLLDFSVTLTAIGGPLRWGDTKEGTLAIRVPESMRADKPGGGTLINAEGLSGAALWGKKSAWNDYFGPVGGETLGMAIFDHPENLRYPTTWHSRTYGLFAANPFGLHDFDPTGKTPKDSGDLLTPEGKSVTFRYRVYFHRGDTQAAQVSEHFAAWATPPSVEAL